jgi:hypothetical protein
MDLRLLEPLRGLGKGSYLQSATGSEGNMCFSLHPLLHMRPVEDYKPLQKLSVPITLASLVPNQERLIF